MRKVILGIGIPGSGKTTILKKILAQNNWVYVSPDVIRKELTKNEADQTRNAEVWERARALTQQALSENHTVLFDATFTNPFQRIEFVRKAREWGAEKVEGFIFDVPIEVAKERNVRRGSHGEKVVPEEYMNRAHGEFRDWMPFLEEGFDTLVTVDKDGRVRELRGENSETREQIEKIQ